MLARIETIIPKEEQNTEIIAEHIVTDLKLLKILMAESDGNTIKADTKSEPTRFIAITIMIAIITAMIRLYASVSNPVALAKGSSKVMQNILS